MTIRRNIHQPKIETVAAQRKAPQERYTTEISAAFPLIPLIAANRLERCGLGYPSATFGIAPERGRSAADYPPEHPPVASAIHTAAGAPSLKVQA